KGAIDEMLAENEQLHLHREDHELMVNGEPLELVGCEFVIEGVFGLLRRMELIGLAFHPGLEERELHALIGTLGRAKPEEVDDGFWLRFSAEHRVPHINLRQLRYTEVAEEAGAAAEGAAAGAPGAATAEAQNFDPQERDRIREVMRGLLGVARGIRLYPLKSKAVSAGIGHLLRALRESLSERRELTLAAAGEALLVNGVRLSGAGVERLANSFVGFLASIKLSGLTFTESITVQEIESFIGAMRQFPSEGGDGTFWERLAAEEGISSIRFGQNLYEVGELPTLLLLEEEAPAELAESLPEPEDPDSEAEFAALLKTLPDRIVKLLLEEETSEIEVLLDYLFNGFERRSVLNRKQAVEACRSSLKTLSTGFQHEFAKLMAEPLLSAFASEEQPDVVREMGALLQLMAGISIQFSAYALACRILSQLHGTYHQYQAAEDPRAESLAEHLDRQIEPATHELLVEDLSSTDPVRQRAAARVLAYVGRVAVPLLIDVVKGATEGRARQIAGSLLAEVEEEAGVLLKRTLAQETDVGQVVRILDVIDTVTRDVNTELARALTDNSEEVRQAALRLAERLNDSQVVELLLEHARGQETELATSVIRWFGRIKAKGVVQEIVSMLTSTHEPARIIACCHALGQSADPVAIEPLATLLSARLALRRRRKWSSEVRAAAALALAKMGHADALAVLEGFTQDKDRAVQRVAQNASISKASSLPPR
ncbi:MAG: HEAT repeat domain-containing protein, partial [Myxococcales bacterium]|nr:HEAT repeat domain-containing protein [Myxococcales bacterium]